MNEQQKTALLKPQIAANPLLDDSKLLDKLVMSDIPVKSNVQTSDLEIYLIANGLWLNFKSNTAPAVEIARDSLTLFSPEIDIQKYQGMFEAMIQGLVDESTFNFTVTNQSDVLAMADSFVSWANQNISNLTMGDIGRARL